MKEKQETKLCKHCKTEIPAGAKVCPNCRKKQSGALKWIIIGVIAIGIIGAAAGGSDDDKVKDVTASQQGSSEPSKESSNEQTSEDSNEPSSEQASEKTEFSVGETAEYKNVQVTLINYEESTGNDWGNPEDGNVFVFAEMEITNNSDKEITISSMLSFECYVDDYKTDFSSNALIAISTEDGKQQLDGNIAPGKKLKGVLGIEAPNDWDIIEIYYKDNAWLDSNFSFKIIK